MSVLHYLDNEVPAFGQWTAVVEMGVASTIVQMPPFPERGTNGLRVIIVAPDVVYVTKTTMLELGDGENVDIGFWVYMPAWPSGTTQIGRLYTGATLVGLLYLYNDGTMRLQLFDDGGGNTWTGFTSALTIGRWNYVVIRLLRATPDVLGVPAADGGADIWINGAHDVTLHTIDNYDRVAGAFKFRLGVSGNPTDGFICDFDEIKVADSYPEPYVPEPESEYPDDAARTTVLYRSALADSVTFADYCVDELGAPRANLCPLPNATANESLADYPTFQAEVETDLAAWFVLNPTVAGNTTCFLVGYGVPGYFTHNVKSHVTTSRLMRYGLLFGSILLNPFYDPAIVTRLTATDLAVEGMYHATRIDAASLVAAKAIVDDGLVASHVTVPDSDIFYHESAAYRASLNAQHLRMELAALTTLTDDALTAFDPIGASATFGAGGSRVAFLHNRANSADSLRGGASSCYEALTEGYASILGFTSSMEHDFTAFFEMLRIGGTLAEAMMVGSRVVDYTIVHAGIPGLKLDFSTTGYNVYRGASDVLNVDYDTPVAYLRRSDTSASLVSLGHGADSEYVYAIRPVWKDVETPDIDSIVTVVMDGAGDWEGNRPDPVIYARAQAESGGDIGVYFSYTPGSLAPDDFALWYDTNPSVDTSGAPDATVTYNRASGEYSHTFTLTNGLTYWFAIAARSGAIESEIVTVGPEVADATGPAAPDVFIASSF